MSTPQSIIDLWAQTEPGFSTACRSVRSILLLADRSHPSNTVKDSIDSLLNCSGFRVVVWNPRVAPQLDVLVAEQFDAIIVHYSVFVFDSSYFPVTVRTFVSAFKGLKVQMVQDEYRRINEVVNAIAELGVHVLVSVLRPHHVAQVYADPRLADVLKISCLPGYVPGFGDEPKTGPIAERSVHLSYRTRPQPFWLGRLAQEKFELAAAVKTRALACGLTVDIESAEENRVYGGGWRELLNNSKAILGAPGGASIFDFDGSVEAEVKQYLSGRPDADFAATWQDVLRKHDGNLVHEQLTPRVFEAIGGKTALVLLEADYRGVVEPWRHYIPLARDYSNFDQVVTSLRDDDQLQQMANTAFREIVQEQGLTNAAFGARLGHIIESCFRSAEQFNNAALSAWLGAGPRAHALDEVELEQQQHKQADSLGRRFQRYLKAPLVGGFLYLSRLLLPARLQRRWVSRWQQVYRQISRMALRSAARKR